MTTEVLTLRVDPELAQTLKTFTRLKNRKLPLTQDEYTTSDIVREALFSMLDREFWEACVDENHVSEILDPIIQQARKSLTYAFGTEAAWDRDRAIFYFGEEFPVRPWLGVDLGYLFAWVHREVHRVDLWLSQNQADICGEPEIRFQLRREIHRDVELDVTRCFLQLGCTGIKRADPTPTVTIPSVCVGDLADGNQPNG